MDASLIQANASNNSVVRRADLDKGYAVLESRLEREVDSSNDNDPPKSGTANRKHVSTTDPDASVCRHSKAESKLQYKVHRGVDDRCEIITATEVTPAEVHDAHRLASLMDRHQSITNNTVTCCVADKKYGTIKNYLTCYDLGIRAHISPLEKSHRGRGRQKGIFAKEVFSYDPISDTFTCPEGQKLQKRNYYKKREKFEYKASSEVCASCQLRTECTRAKDGRTLKRHVRQEDLDKMLKTASSAEAERDIKKRQHLVERSFARGTRYGFKRARWRRLWRVRIQEYLTAAVQNLMVLLKYVKEPALA
jgi:hypothetical protein